MEKKGGGPKSASDGLSGVRSSHNSSDRNFGLINLIFHGATSIKVVSAAVVAFVLGLAMIGGAIWLRSGTTEEADSSEAEQGSSSSTPSIAPAVRGQKVHITGDCYGGSMVPNKTIDEVEEFYDLNEVSIGGFPFDRHNELAEALGVEESVIAVSFTVHASNNELVTIDNLVAEIEYLQPAPEGVVLRERCGDAVPTNYTRLDLDTESFDVELPSANNYIFGEDIERNIDSSGRELVDLGLPYQISGDESTSFVIVPTTDECWCEWTLTLEWSSYSDEGEVVIDNYGEPFVTISPANMEHYLANEDPESDIYWQQD